MNKEECGILIEHKFKRIYDEAYAGSEVFNKYRSCYGSSVCVNEVRILLRNIRDLCEQVEEYANRLECQIKEEQTNEQEA